MDFISLCPYTVKSRQGGVNSSGQALSYWSGPHSLLPGPGMMKAEEYCLLVYMGPDGTGSIWIG